MGGARSKHSSLVPSCCFSSLWFLLGLALELLCARATGSFFSTACFTTLPPAAGPDEVYRSRALKGETQINFIWGGGFISRMLKWL